MSRFVRSLSIALPALVVMIIFGCATSNPATPADVSQGWDANARGSWYTASQGSRLIPRAWLDNLEQPGADNTGMFLDPAYMQTFRYLPNPTGQSPDAKCPFDQSLPLGFTVDCQSGSSTPFTQLQWKAAQAKAEPWVGMNCSACHTTQMTYKGTTFRAEGGPSLTDFQSFTANLSTAVYDTSTVNAKFDRFARKVLGANASPADRTLLKTALGKWFAWNDKLDTLNDPNRADPASRIPAYGFGRLDAIGHIYNKISLLATPSTILQQTANPSDAPTSFPFLWNVPQLDRVEWNGIASNTVVAGVHVGALGRNSGEVIGVFGDVAIKKNPGLGGYASSVIVKTLNDMEAQLQSLKPPVWPAAFGPIDPRLADTGRQLFAKDCAGCHTVPTKGQGDLTEQFKVTLQPVFPVAGTNEKGSGTDFWMACNAVLDSANSGLFTGNKAQVVVGDPIQDPSQNLILLTNAVTGVIANNKWDVAKLVIFHSNGLPPPVPPSFAAAIDAKNARATACRNFPDDPTDPKMVYKGRPLQGIWATAPFLHNGSVPNLWEILLPPAQRSKTFYTGSREFDPKSVGYETAKSADNSFLFDTSLPGNANTGHDYNNAGLTDADRSALVEYMKTL
jgi:hypothetical protein